MWEKPFLGSRITHWTLNKSLSFLICKMGLSVEWCTSSAGAGSNPVGMKNLHRTQWIRESRGAGDWAGTLTSASLRETQELILEA